MRISDWSSDVCSSDLVAVEVHRDEVGQLDEARVDVAAGAGIGRRDDGDDVVLEPLDIVLLGQPVDRGRVLPGVDRPAPQGARKRVVEGKSVSVRVDLGDRRIIKKNSRKKEANQ